MRLGQFWDYENKKWSGVETSKFKDALGISVFPIDWDADGDLDLLLGGFDGRMFLRLNEGSAKRTAFATKSVQVKAAGQPLQVPGRHAMPVAADWDGDGLWDLVTGSGQGGAYWYRNVGKKGAPRFAGVQTLVAPGTGGVGQRTQVAVADFDADGRVDLLVGDFRSAKKADGKNRYAYNGWVWLFRRKPATPAGLATGSHR